MRTKRKSKSEGHTVITTIGEFIATLTQIAMESGKSEKESYRYAAFAIRELSRSDSLSANQKNISSELLKSGDTNLE